MKKRTFLGLAGIAAAGAGVAGGLTAIGNLLYRSGIAAPARENRSDRWPTQQEGRMWAREGEGFSPVSLTAPDGLLLRGYALLAGEGEHRWAICMHGYRDSMESMGAVARHYAGLGWNVLLPDQRGHGQSEGDYVGWGYDERLDLLSWINFVARRDPEARILLHGVSMGAATVLMVTGGPLPKQVKVAVSDCSYTAIEPEMKHVVDRRMRKKLNIPVQIPFNLLFSALRRITLRRAGYDLKDVSPIEAVARSSTPTLFIHGEEDEVVPPAMLGKLYQAANCPKSFLVVPEAGHTEAVGARPELYWAAVDPFAAKYMD